MKFFESFWKASFYKGGKATSFWGAFGKIVLVSFLVSISTAICVYMSFGIHIPSHVYSYGVQALHGYPSDLVVSVKNGSLTKNTSNVVQLYPIPEGTMSDPKMDAILPGYIFSINDKEYASLDAYKRANALILLAKDGVVVQGNKQQLEILTYKDLLHNQNEFTITKATIGDMVSAVNEYAPYAPRMVSLVIIICISLFAPLFYLLFTFLTALVVRWLSPQLFKKVLTYKESYIYSLYALAPVILVTELLKMVPYVRSVANHIPFLELLLVLAFLWFMLQEVRVKTKESVTTKKESKPKVVKKVAAKKVVKKKAKTTKE
jgi:hypothetical protein